MSYTNRRVRYEDLNYRVVTDNANKVIWLEKATIDALGDTQWQRLSLEQRDVFDVDIPAGTLLKIFWSLLDRYTINLEQHS